ncbi:MAG TPA: hypothetical protein VFZ28_10485 [Burkholderiaceae bacterium]|nr:hypothetical protein [Burkholderiaceae bacterium]
MPPAPRGTSANTTTADGLDFPDKRSAIATSVPRLDAGSCARCTVKLFDECPR